MDISAIKTRLVEIQESIDGITRAYDNGPASLPETDLPLFVNFAGGQNLEPGSGDTIHEARDFLMRLYVSNAQSGLDGEAEAEVEQYIAPVYSAFDQEMLLSAIPFVRDAVIVSDGGVVVLPYAGVQFLGIEFRLRVRAFRPATY